MLLCSPESCLSRYDMSRSDYVPNWACPEVTMYRIEDVPKWRVPKWSCPETSGVAARCLMNRSVATLSRYFYGIVLIPLVCCSFRCTPWLLGLILWGPARPCAYSIPLFAVPLRVRCPPEQQVAAQSTYRWRRLAHFAIGSKWLFIALGTLPVEHFNQA